MERTLSSEQRPQWCLNSALFYYDYRDLQLLAAQAEYGSTLTTEVIDVVDVQQEPIGNRF